MSRPTLDPVELRVLGALIEKSLAVPEVYPMTLAALVAACNQKTSREPVTDFDARDVQAAVERLMRRGLAGTTAGAGHRVAKFRHLADRSLGLSRRELAALAVLMLRGPQTPGEIRTRAARMADLASVEAAAEALWLLEDRDEPLAATLPRQPGQAAARSAHLLGGPLPTEPAAPGHPSLAEPAPPPRTPEAAPGRTSLAERVDALEAEVADLRAELDRFRAQFE